MKKQHVKIISDKLNISEQQVENTVRLFEEGATIPFISRYRKEVTGSLDEVAITSVKQQAEKLEAIETRRKSIIDAIDKQDKLTYELRQKLESTWDMTELEDLYLPYKQKRKTRATVAREKGLEPLAKIIMKQNERDIHLRADSFINDKVKDTEEALQGARDIIAEWINENKGARNRIRRLFSREAVVRSTVIKGKEEDGIKYKDYFSYEEPLRKCVSHRMLAIRRGEDDGTLKVTILPSKDKALVELENIFVKADNECSGQVVIAVKDSYKRLLSPSIESEFRSSSKEEADIEAIKVFSGNLRQLLLAPPLGQKNILAIDPGYRTGCKVVCLDNQGNLLHNETIYPHKPQQETAQAKKKIASMVNAYKIEAIAIGNGTAGRETEHFVKSLKLDREVKIFVVNEDGASAYSASTVAREEFPQYDVTVRGAVSIGRRLMDPLAELVKIDPKSIGVGQYQHDVDQSLLKESLNNVVESCVNMVGVNINTASKHLLTYVSGLGPQLAQNIVEYRKENGNFKNRNEIMNVSRMGAKVFVQCAGFLRIPDADNSLDNSAVHPESYYIVEQMASDNNCSVSDLIADDDQRKKIDINKYVNNDIGIPTLKDILEELEKPGRDPRKIIILFEFSDGIYSMEDLEPGMVLPGIVTNITNFGAFVDIGVKQHGLVHISNLANRFVSNPSEIVSINQHVKVKVLEVDIERKRIQLSMKDIE